MKSTRPRDQETVEQAREYSSGRGLSSRRTYTSFVLRKRRKNPPSLSTSESRLEKTKLNMLWFVVYSTLYLNRFWMLCFLFLKCHTDTELSRRSLFDYWKYVIVLIVELVFELGYYFGIMESLYVFSRHVFYRQLVECFLSISQVIHGIITGGPAGIDSVWLVHTMLISLWVRDALVVEEKPKERKKAEYRRKIRRCFNIDNYYNIVRFIIISSSLCFLSFSFSLYSNGFETTDTEPTTAERLHNGRVYTLRCVSVFIQILIDVYLYIYFHSRMTTILKKTGCLLRKKGNDVSGFLKAFSHVIRTNLMGIQGCHGSKNLSPDDAQALSCCSECIKRVVDDLDSIGEKQYKMEFAFFTKTFRTDFVVGGLLKCLESIYKREVIARNITIRNNVDMTSLPPTLKTDALRTIQVICYLFNYCVKCTSSGEIFINFFYSNGKLHFLCEDTGEGLSDQDLEFIKSFFASDSDFINASEGEIAIRNGKKMNLELVKVLLRALGGEIDLGSDGKGYGTWIHMKFPASIPSPEEEKRQVPPEKPCRKKPNSEKTQKQELPELSILPSSVMIIDDSILCREVEKRQVKSIWKGVQIFEAKNGLEAWEMIQNNENIRPDMILCDLDMPKMRGEEFSKKLYAEGPSDYTYYISAVTAGSGFRKHQIREFCKKNCFDMFLLKPVVRKSFEFVARHYSVTMKKKAEEAVVVVQDDNIEEENKKGREEEQQKNPEEESKVGTKEEAADDNKVATEEIKKVDGLAYPYRSSWVALIMSLSFNVFSFIAMLDSSARWYLPLNVILMFRNIYVWFVFTFSFLLTAFIRRYGDTKVTSILRLVFALPAIIAVSLSLYPFFRFGMVTMLLLSSEITSKSLQISYSVACLASFIFLQIRVGSNNDCCTSVLQMLVFMWHSVEGFNQVYQTFSKLKNVRGSLQKTIEELKVKSMQQTRMVQRCAKLLVLPVTILKVHVEETNKKMQKQALISEEEGGGERGEFAPFVVPSTVEFERIIENFAVYVKHAQKGIHKGKISTSGGTHSVDRYCSTEPLHVNGMINHFVDRIKPLYPSKRLHLELGYLKIVPVDNRFSLILENIISNALAHSTPHSDVIVETRVKQKKFLIVRVENKAVITGNVEMWKRKLFVPFHQPVHDVDSPTTANPRMRIGLFCSKVICDYMGIDLPKIRVESLGDNQYSVEVALIVELVVW